MNAARAAHVLALGALAACGPYPGADHPDDPPECRAAELARLSQEYTTELIRHCGGDDTLSKCVHYDAVRRQYAERFDAWAECRPANPEYEQ